jgi:hypothetical protein
VIPANLAERLFARLFTDYDLITADGTTIAVPKGREYPGVHWFHLERDRLQIASYREAGG